MRICAEPIDLGPPDWVLRPYVMGPNAVPVIKDPAVARERPELALLSAMAHGRSEAGLDVALAALAAAAGLSPEQQRLHVDVILSSVNEAVKRRLEPMLKGGYEYQSDFARTYVAQGRQEAVLTVLEARGLEIPADVRERVLGSTDLAELDRWIRRAAVVSEARELFATPAS